jgi:Flp pilus assembly protein TadG
MRIDRKGNMAIVSSLLVVVVLAAGAIAVDTAAMQVADVELRQAGESVALAAANLVDGTNDGFDDAYWMAMRMSQLNTANGSAVDLYDPDNGTVTFGHWEDEAFTEGTSTMSEVNAIKVMTVQQGWTGLFSSIAFGSRS